jgi:hypothetical protein
MADDKGGTIESLNIKIGVNADNVLNTLNNINSLFQNITASANVATQAVNQLAVALLNLNNAKDSVKITPEKIIPTSSDSSNPESVRVEAEKKAGEKSGKGKVFDGAKVHYDDLNKGVTAGATAEATAEREASRGTGGTRMPRNAVNRAGQRLDYATRRWVNRLRSLVMPLIAAFSVRALWKGFMDGTKLIEGYSEKLDMSANTLDKWSKANAYAGGTQKGFLEAMTKWTQATGKTGDEFIETMLHLNELSEAEQKAFMKTNQLTKEQVALFLQSDSAIQGTLQAVGGIAYTDEDIQKQKEFNIAWTQFKIQVQGLGDVLIRTIVPVFTWIIQKATAITGFMNRHAQMLKIIGGLLSVAFGNVLIMQMMKGIGLGARLVSVFKYLTKGFALFSKTLWASPLTWYIAALAGLLLILEDIYYFITGTKKTFTYGLLEWLGFSKEDIHDIRQELYDAGKIISDAWTQIKEKLKPIGDILTKWGIAGGKGVVGAIVGLITMAVLGVVRLMAMLVKFGDEFGGAIYDALHGDTKEFKKMLKNIADTIGNVLGNVFFSLGVMIGEGLLSVLKKIPFMNDLIGDIENGTSNFKFGDILKYTPVNGMTGGLVPRIVNYFQEKMTQNNNINIDSSNPEAAGGSVVRALNSSRGTNLPRDWGWAREVWVNTGVKK